MESEKELLQQEYNLTIDAEDPWYFFLNLSNYVIFAKSIPSLMKVIEELENEKEIRIKEIEKFEDKALIELKESKEKLEKTVNKIAGLRESLKKRDPFPDALTSIDMYLDGRIHTGGTVTDVLSRYLYEIAWDLENLHNSKLLDPFTAEFGKTARTLTFSKSLPKRQELTKTLENERNINSWGYWDYLLLLKDKDIFSNTMTGPNVTILDQALITEYVHLKMEIRSNRKDDSFPRQEKMSFSRESNVETYKHYLARIHLFFQREFALKDEKSAILGVDFDSETSRLTVAGTAVSFRKFTDQYHVLNTVFSNKDELNKEWFFSELAEEMDQFKKYKDKDFYNYLSAINRRIATETGLKDIFLTNTQSVKINTKYLK